MPASAAEHDVHEPEGADGYTGYAVHPGHVAVRDFRAHEICATGQDEPPSHRSAKYPRYQKRGFPQGPMPAESVGRQDRQKRKNRGGIGHREKKRRGEVGMRGAAVLAHFDRGRRLEIKNNAYRH